MTINEALKFAKIRVNSDFVAREIIKFCENFTNESLVLNLNAKLSDFDKFSHAVERFAGGIPLEYITNKAEFFGLDFFVDERVLIPRFETEILVKKVLNIASNFKNPKICEIGTGSGIISICLRKNLRGAKIIATDISQNAIEVAKINAKKHGAKIEFKHTSLMDAVEGEFDIIVSNPPYIANSYELDARVLNEPKIALFGGEVGNEILEKIVQIAKTRAKFLACEMGYDQKESMEKILQNANFHAIFYKDLAGFDRGFSAKNRNLV